MLSYCNIYAEQFKHGDYLHLVVDLDGVGQVVEVGGDLRDALLEVEDVHGELVRLVAGSPEQLGRVLHERLVRLEYYQ